MALQFSTAIRDDFNDQITANVGASAKLRFYSGTKPATCGTALAGNTQLAELNCDATFAPASSSGVLTLNSISNDTSADATGTATFFRIYDSAGTTCHVQGDVGTSGSDVNVSTTSFQAGVIVSVTSWTITAPGA